MASENGDAWGQRLHGCIQCNQWMNSDGEWQRLPEQDIAALRGWVAAATDSPSTIRAPTKADAPSLIIKALQLANYW
jgi:hypothetical protein